MKSFSAALIVAVSQAIAVQDGYENEYEHVHTDYGTQTTFVDVEVVYDEFEYTI